MSTTVHDPVCHMDIDPATAAGTSEYKGQTYYFCSMGCKKSTRSKLAVTHTLPAKRDAVV